MIRCSLLTCATLVALGFGSTASAVLVATPGDGSGGRDTIGSAGINYQLGNHLSVANDEGDSDRAAVNNGNINGQLLSVSFNYTAATGELVTTSGGTAGPVVVTDAFNDIVLFSRFDNRGSSSNNVSGGSLDISNLTVLLDGVDQGATFSDTFFDHGYVSGVNQFTFGTLSMPGLSTQDIDINFDIVSSYTSFNGNNNNAGARISFNANLVAIPEPSVAIVGGLVAAGLAISGRRKSMGDESVR